MIPNGADLLLMGGDAIPDLNDSERDAVIRIGSAGGRLPHEQPGWAVFAALSRAQVVASAGPGMIELTALGVRAQADMATAVTRDA